MKLDLYNKKRDFKKTPEPKGKISKKSKNLFVIQKHAASHLHYDFRLELNGVLLSWAVPKGPCLDPTVKRLAMHVEDHPVEYGGFEGIIPQGEYGGGTVMLWDKGEWISEDANPHDAYRKGHLRFQLKAKKLQGSWSLIRIRKDNKSWLLIKKKDEYARPLNRYDITEEEPNSVLSHESIDEIAENYRSVWGRNGLVKAKKNKLDLSSIKINLPARAMPKHIFPQLATLVDQAPTGKEWLHELKFDGYRILTFKQNNNVKFISRNNRDWSDYFSNIFLAIKKIPIKNIVLDGEIVLLDKNQRSNFQLLQNAIGAGKNKFFIYYIFDILYYDKYLLTSLPLLERKKILQAILTSYHHSALKYSDHIIGSGPDVFKNACEMGLEGIISKEINSTYEEKRSKAWLKIKCVQRQEFVIGGFSPPKRSRQFFGSLYLGYFDKKGVFIYCGNVGTGFNQQSLKAVYNQLQKIITPRNPFNIKPPGITSATWVKPQLVVEIEFSEWTSDGLLRHPSFKGLRSDKPASAIHREMKENISIAKKSSCVKRKK